MIANPKRKQKKKRKKGENYFVLKSKFVNNNKYNN